MFDQRSRRFPQSSTEVTPPAVAVTINHEQEPLLGGQQQLQKQQQQYHNNDINYYSSSIISMTAGSSRVVANENSSYPIPETPPSSPRTSFALSSPRHHRLNSTTSSNNDSAYTPRTRARKIKSAGRPALVSQPEQRPLLDTSLRYDWRLFSPSCSSLVQFGRWLIVGGSRFAPPQSDEELLSNLRNLARCLTLLRAYLVVHGMPTRGGADDQSFVLRQVLRDLYGGGVPIWSLESFMLRVAEGLTGQKGVNWFLLPRKAFVFAPNSGTTSMFRIDRGFNMNKLQYMETVAIRLASFASNTRGVGNIPSRFPKSEELQRAAREGTTYGPELNLLKTGDGGDLLSSDMDKEEMEEEILALASGSASLFFFLNSEEYKAEDVILEDDFWVVSDKERELFSRLATLEAMNSLAEIDANTKVLYAPWLITFFRFLTSAGAAAFWFNGSFWDMLVAGILAVLVGMIEQSSVLTREERIVFEVVASLGVGITAGVIANRWSDDTCFAAMALGGVLDILQGFRVVYACIEILSKHTVCGGADLVEGILFTGLIAYFLRFGQNIAGRILQEDASDRVAVYLQCNNGINELWYIVLVPVTALSWSVSSFTPQYQELPLMCFHGMIAYAVNYAMSLLHVSNDLNNFVSALVVSTSAGVFSRFSGRSSVAYTVAGLYVLLPGAYLVKSLFSSTLDGRFFTDIVQSAIVIGLGAWSGTILCSPTLLGTTSGFLNQQQSERRSARNLRSDPSQIFF